MASKKPVSKNAAKKAAAPRTAAPKVAAPINVTARRRAASERADRLYVDWKQNAILLFDNTDFQKNIAELQKILARNCTTADLCIYLRKLATWLLWFQEDYTKLRQAVCNVERRAWGGSGDQNLRFCQGGAGNEPADPTPPPIWT